MQVEYATTITGSVPRSAHFRAGKSASTARQPKDAALVNALTIIAHDLRGPLANLAILLELIETHVAMQAHERARHSTRKAQSMIGMLDELLCGFLERARETGDPLAFESGLVDLTDVAGDVLSLNSPMATARGVALACESDGPCVVGGDRRLLVEALDNLVSNAVKHAPEGSIVRCVIERSGGWASIRVVDEGQGLSEGDLQKAFRPFQTLSSAYRAKGASWGLGLWIVRLIAERHGGRVEVTARDDGPGACFVLHLPAGRL